MTSRLFSRRSRNGNSTGRSSGCFTLVTTAFFLIAAASLLSPAGKVSNHSVQDTSQPSVLTTFADTAASYTGYNSYNNNNKNDDAATTMLNNPLGVPPGQAINLPSVRIEEQAVDNVRKIYGGAGDQKHLGGFTELDLHGVSPAVWSTMLEEYGVHSVLDVGCGRGISTAWFALHGADVKCVEGSHDAVEQNIVGSLVPNSVVEHDFSRGPWWPANTYDAVWAVEFLEHVGVNYQYNYVTAFRKAALLFVTSSRWGGWHHVEVHNDEWWIRKYESFGFRYDAALTEQIRRVANLESKQRNTTAPNGQAYNGQHIYLSMKVFVNPTVAALPQHAHLFPQHGCYGGKDPENKKDAIVHRKCGEGKDGALESVLPDKYFPLQTTEQQDQEWADLIREHITIKEGNK